VGLPKPEAVEAGIVLHAIERLRESATTPSQPCSWWSDCGKVPRVATTPDLDTLDFAVGYGVQG
jgi:hypothetical protein